MRATTSTAPGCLGRRSRSRVTRMSPTKNRQIRKRAIVKTVWKMSGNPVTCELAEAAMKCLEEMRGAGHVRFASGHPYLGIIHRIISMAAK
jgi:hypothetical protein